MARSDSAKVNLALEVLRGVLPRFLSADVATAEVRLALNVLDGYLPNCPALAEFWRRATNEIKHPWESGHGEYQRMVGALRRAGWEIDPANIL